MSFYIGAHIRVFMLTETPTKNIPFFSPVVSQLLSSREITKMAIPGMPGGFLSNILFIIPLPP